MQATAASKMYETLREEQQNEAVLESTAETKEIKEVTKSLAPNEITGEKEPDESKITVFDEDDDDDVLTEYPILSFDNIQLERLHDIISRMLARSKIKPAGGKLYEFIKRAGDIVLSLIGIALAAIPVLIIALLIFLEDGGNPFFSQIRLTKNG